MARVVRGKTDTGALEKQVVLVAAVVGGRMPRGSTCCPLKSSLCPENVWEALDLGLGLSNIGPWQEAGQSWLAGWGRARATAGEPWP